MIPIYGFRYLHGLPYNNQIQVERWWRWGQTQQQTGKWNDWNKTQKHFIVRFKLSRVKGFASHLKVWPDLFIEDVEVELFQQGIESNNRNTHFLCKNDFAFFWFRMNSTILRCTKTKRAPPKPHAILKNKAILRNTIWRSSTFYWQAIWMFWFFLSHSYIILQKN